MADVTCACGTTFAAKSARARYCSDRCRKRASRSGADVVELPAPPAARESDARLGPAAKATMKALEEVDRQDSPLGAAAMALAMRLDQPGTDTGSALAAVARQLEATLTSATRGAGGATAPDQLRDELAARRAKHA